MTFTRKLLTESKEKGVALIIAIFTMVVISYLVVEISYESNVEYIVNANAVSRLKAYYAAKSGVELSLLRIKIFSRAQGQFSQMAGGNVPAQQKKMLDLIWNFPFMWPPEIPTEALNMDKETMQDAIKESKMDAQYQTFITDEGSKIDINDLASPSKGIRDATRRLLVSIFENRMRNDEEWANANRDLKYEEVLNNITDWIDDDQTAINGGSERQMYQNIFPDLLPPNRGFRTVDELRMVSGMTPEIFNMLKDRVTVFGMKAINPNYASRELLMSLDPSMTEEAISEIIKRRSDDDQGGFFSAADEFWQFANSKGAAVPPDVQQSTPLVFDTVQNFRIRSVGSYNNTTREIEAIVFDLNATAATVASKLVEEKREGDPPPAGEKKDTQTAKEPLPKGPPRIVYWFER